MIRQAITIICGLAVLVGLAIFNNIWIPLLIENETTQVLVALGTGAIYGLITVIPVIMILKRINDANSEKTE